MRQIVHGVVQQAYTALEEVLQAQRDEFPIILWPSLRDDPTREGIGHSFVPDERNPWPVDGTEWLISRLFERGKFARQGETMQPGKMKQWMRLVERFRAVMLVCVYITGGQPARGPEILSIRHSSAGTGEGRNVFIEDGGVVFITRYHKGYNISGDIKVIHRYLPREVGALMVWYIWLIVPAIKVAERVIRGQTPAPQWQVWPTDGAKGWTSARISRAMRQASAVHLRQDAVTIQLWRTMSIAINRKHVRKGEGRFRWEDEDCESEADEDDIEDIQAGHGTYVAGIVYARGIREQDGAVESTRQKFRRANKNWHRFLGFEVSSSSPDGSIRKRIYTQWEEEADMARRERYKRVKQTDVSDALRDMLNNGEARFRGRQKEMVEAIT